MAPFFQGHLPRHQPCALSPVLSCWSCTAGSPVASFRCLESWKRGQRYTTQKRTQLRTHRWCWRAVCRQSWQQDACDPACPRLAQFSSTSNPCGLRMRDQERVVRVPPWDSRKAQASNLSLLGLRPGDRPSVRVWWLPGLATWTGVHRAVGSRARGNKAEVQEHRGKQRWWHRPGSSLFLGPWTPQDNTVALTAPIPQLKGQSPPPRGCWHPK